MSGDHDACPKCGAGCFWCSCGEEKQAERAAYIRGAKDFADEVECRLSESYGKCFICGEEVPMDHACLNAQVHMRCEGELNDFIRLRAENERWHTEAVEGQARIAELTAALVAIDHALAFGGPVVLKVEFDDDVIEGVRQRTIADGDEWWQFHVLEVVPPCQIKGDAE